MHIMTVANIAQGPADLFCAEIIKASNVCQTKQFEVIVIQRAGLARVYTV